MPFGQFGVCPALARHRLQRLKVIYMTTVQVQCSIESLIVGEIVLSGYESFSIRYGINLGLGPIGLGPITPKE